MKKIISCFLLFSALLFSQSYLNILFNNGTYKNATISSLQKMTLSTSGDQINFYLIDGTIATENIDEIRKMTLGDTPEGDPLPVELSSFSAILNGASVVLLWRTESEVNNYGFEVERASDSSVKEWKKIGFIEGYGNSNSPKDYSFADTPKGGTKFQYRLKQIDTDGKYEYSNIVSIEIGIPVKYELKQNFPNPFNPATNIIYNLPADGFVTIIVYDVVGREVTELVNENKKAGSYLVTFNGNNFSSGVYFCRINSGIYSSSIKMMLIK